MLRLFIFTTIFANLDSIDIYDYDDRQSKYEALVMDNPYVNATGNLGRTRKISPREIQCDVFSVYAFNCTIQAAKIYNSKRKAPPMPSTMSVWCMAIKSLTDCAIEWNNQCKDVTDSHFNEESVKGHMHVVSNICDDDKFLMRYDDLPECIDSTSYYWESCYSIFKEAVDHHKNTSLEWTHFEVHFYLCCARAKFRRCTLDSLFKRPTNCTHDQAMTLQKFSVIVSEGDVFQNCDFHMMYADCPGGDPRPTGTILKSILSDRQFFLSSARKIRGKLWIYLYCFIFLCQILYFLYNYHVFYLTFFYFFIYN